MRHKKRLGVVMAGSIAGVINGLFGAGGGMVLVPLLTLMTPLEEESIFPASISMILPICLVSLAMTAVTGSIPFRQALPYLFGSCIGGWFAGVWGRRIPVLWLHRGLGVLILWGGIRYLC